MAVGTPSTPQLLSPIRAFVVAVLDDDVSLRGPQVVGRFVEWLNPDGRQKPTLCRMSTTWMRPGCSWWISRILPTALFCP
jgi:hypothetical protein